MTAAYFGKLLSADEVAKVEKSDLAAALLMLIVQETAATTRAFLGRYEPSPPVFFVGGFLTENEPALEIIARSFRSLKLDPPYFLRHSDFLGALGALAHAELDQLRASCLA